jgi:putative oxidoreductase
MNDQRNKMPLYFPGFDKIYDMFRPISYLVLRLVVGGLFVPHGAQKLFQMFGGRPFGDYQAAFARMGDFWGHPFWVYYIGSLELIGGLMVAIGFFTRFAATQLFLFMAMATFVGNAGRGWFWTGGGSEMPALWGIALWYVMVHGSGGFSVDKAIGKQI